MRTTRRSHGLSVIAALALLLVPVSGWPGSFTVATEIVIPGYSLVATAHLIIVEDDGTTERIITTEYQIVTVGGPNDGNRTTVARTEDSRPSPLGLRSRTEFPVTEMVVESVPDRTETITETITYPSALTPGDLTTAPVIAATPVAFDPADELVTFTDALWSPSLTIATAAAATATVGSDEAQEETDALSRAQLAPLAGDPVRTSTGRLEHTELLHTLELGRISLPVALIHRTDERFAGSAGPGWYFSLDARLVFGTSPAASDALRTIRNALEDLTHPASGAAAQAEAAFTDANGDRHDLLRQVGSAIAEADELAAALRSIRYSGPLRTEVNAAVASRLRDVADTNRELTALESRLRGEISTIEGTIAPNARSAIEAAETEIRAIAAAIEALAAASLEAERRNARFAACSSGPARATGADNVVFIGVDGLPRRFELRDGAAAAEGSGVLYLETDGTFAVGMEDGTLWRFGEFGELREIQDGNGNRVVFEYDSADRLSGFYDSRGREFAVERTAGGKLSTIEGPASLTYSFEYTNGRLAEITDPAGDTTAYRYEADRLSAIVRPDESERVYSYETAPAGFRVESVTDEERSTEVFRYPSTGTVEHTDPDGVSRTYIHDDLGRLVRIEYGEEQAEEWSWSADGRVVTHQSVDGHVVVTEYDERDRPVSRRYPDGTTERWEYAPDPVVDGHAVPAGDQWVWRHVAPDGSVVVRTRDTAGNLRVESYPDGTSEQYTYVPRGFAAAGDVLEHTDRRGNRTRYEYDARGFLTGIRDSEGQVAMYEHDQLGRPTAVRRPGAGGITVEYRLDGLVARVSGPGATETAYSYNERKDLVAADRGGAVIRFAYNSRHELLSRTDPTGVAEHFTYSLAGRIKSTWKEAPDWVGRFGLTEYYYDDQGELNERVIPDADIHERYDSSASGLIRAARDPLGLETTYEYDARGRLIFRSVLLPAGTKVERWTWRHPAPGVTELTYEDAAGRSWKTTADAGARSLTRTGPDGALIEGVTLNPYGLPLSVTDGEANTTTWEYDFRGRLTSTAYNGFPRGSAAYDEFDRLIRSSDGTGGTWGFAYDVFDHPVSQTNPDGSVRRWELDAESRVLSLTDETDRTTRYAYDAAGRLVSRLAPGAPRDEQTRWTWHPLGLPASVTDPTGRTTSYEYYATGLLKRATDPAGGTTGYTYDAAGHLVEETDASMRSRSFAYDALGRRTHFYEAGELVWTNVFDATGNLVRTTDGIGVSRTFGHDPYGRVTVETTAAGTRTVGYDQSGRVHEVVEPDGATATYSYSRDALETRVDYTSPTAPNAFTRIRSDAAGRIVEAENEHSFLAFTWSARGLLQHTDDGLWSSGLTCDAAGRQRTVTTTGHGISASTSTLYGPDGLARSVLSPAGTFHLSRDDAGRGTTLLYPNRITSETHYDAADRIAATVARSADGLAVAGTAYVRDASGRILHTIDETLALQSYQYDQRGRVSGESYPAASVTRPVLPTPASDFPPAIRTPIEDAARLIYPLRKGAPDYAAEAVAREYAYDRAGNRVSSTDASGSTRSTINANGRLVAAGDTTYDYSVRGNLTQRSAPDSHVTYNYDARGRLSGASNGTAQVRYLHDALGRQFMRVETPETTAGELQKPTGETAAATVNHYVGLSFEPAATAELELGTDGLETALTKLLRPSGLRYAAASSSHLDTRAVISTTVTFHVAIGGRVVADTRGTPGTSRFHFHDEAGSVALNVRTDGSTERHHYDAFGSSLNDASAQRSSNLSFAGNRYDPVARTYTYGLRDYDPTTGRFTTPDPLRDRFNWYGYPNADPVNIRDPLGLSPASDRAAAGNGTFGGWVMRQVRERLIIQEKVSLMEEIRNYDMYQPGARGNYNRDVEDKTWCNQACFDYTAATSPVLFHAMTGGVDRRNTIGPVDPSYDVDANEAYAKLVSAATGNDEIEEITGEEAQRMGNLGYTVVAARPDSPSGHLVVVTPDLGGYNPNRGPLTSGVGLYGGDALPAREAFAGRPGARYFVDRTEDLTYIDQSQVGNRAH